MGHPRIRTGLGVLLVILLAGAAAGGGYLTGHHIRDGRPALPAASSVFATPAAVARATEPPPAASPSAAPVPSRLAAALAPALADPRLGGRLLAQVSDAQGGAVLFRRGDSTAAPPASTAKLATAIATLTVHRPDERITTRVVAGAAPGTVVLVGAGDPTLTAAEASRPGAYASAARISTLAAELQRRGTPIVRVIVDGSLFAGPAVSPAWAPGDAPSDYAAPITAAMVDGGRDSPDAPVRSAEPDLAAGRALAAALGLPSSAVSTGRSPAGATVLASVRSAGFGDLVGQMLQQSDNVIAECLARLVSLARGGPASFAGGAAAVRAVVRGLGVDIGAGLTDGSGLAASDRLTPAALGALLRLATQRPALATVIAALPVSAWSGTLQDRFTGSAAAGLVRAKTGTLTSVSSLAGVVHDRDGRLLVFALIADRVGPSTAATDAAEAALDRIAATVAACGCT